MRRLFVLGILLWVPAVWAQSLDKLPIKFDFWTAEPVLTMDMVHGRMPVSGGCGGYSFGKTGYTLLAPSDFGAQNGVAVRITAIAVDASGNPLPGAVRSKNLTVTQATRVKFVWETWNASSGYGNYWEDGANEQTWQGGLSGSATWGPWPNGDVGHKWNFVYTATGANGTSTDRIPSVSIVAGNTPGIISEDGVVSNAYLQANPNFGGGDMMHTCQICIQQPSACSGAQHTPYISGSMTNHTSGEVQTFQRQQAGSVVSENDPISGSAFWAISVLPGDQTDGDATGEIFCTAVADDIFNQNNPNNDGLGVPGIELAWFKGTIKQSTCKLYNYKGNAGVDCKYLYGTQSNGSRTFPMCTTRTWIPDFQPNDVFIPAALVPGYPDLALVPPFYFALSAGLRWPNLPGYPWQFPFYYLDQVTPVLPTALAQATDLLNWTFISQNSKIRDCTSADNGYQVLIYFPGID